MVSQALYLFVMNIAQTANECSNLDGATVKLWNFIKKKQHNIYWDIVEKMKMSSEWLFILTLRYE